MSAEDRQLMINSESSKGMMRKYSFMKLPAELQEEITEGIDARQLTFAQAAERCKEAGFEITGESVRRYYKGLLATRRRESFRDVWLKAADILREMGTGDKVIETFMAYMTSQMMAGIELGQIEFPVKEFMKFMEAFPAFLARAGQGPGGKPIPVDVPARVSANGKRKIRQEVYGF